MWLVLVICVLVAVNPHLFSLLLRVPRLFKYPNSLCVLSGVRQNKSLGQCCAGLGKQDSHHFHFPPSEKSQAKRGSLGIELCHLEEWMMWVKWNSSYHLPMHLLSDFLLPLGTRTFQPDYVIRHSCWSRHFCVDMQPGISYSDVPLFFSIIWHDAVLIIYIKCNLKKWLSNTRSIADY